MPIYKNGGRYVVSYSRRGVTMRTSVMTEVEAVEIFRSMQEDDVVETTKTRYCFSKDKIFLIHIPNLKCETYDSIYGVRDPSYL